MILMIGCSSRSLLSANYQLEQFLTSEYQLKLSKLQNQHQKTLKSLTKMVQKAYNFIKGGAVRFLQANR